MSAITYDFYQRCTKLPPEQLAKATNLRVHLNGSLSATGQGHGTERACLAGIIGKEPATIDPAFLDELAAKPDQTFPVKLGTATFDASLKDLVFDDAKGDFPHPNTMTCKLLAGDKVLLEQEYYSVVGGFIEWKGYTPPKKGAQKYPYATMKELQQDAEKDKLSVAQVVRTNEVAVSGRTDAEIDAFLDKIAGAMVAIVKSGSRRPSPRSRVRSSRRPRRARSTSARRTTPTRSSAGLGVVAAYALAGSEENARGHLVVTVPTGGSAGVIPALVYALGEDGRKLPHAKIRSRRR
ncbi:MAG: serine dehydratase beta chain [Candidatus Binatia bacterium]